MKPHQYADLISECRESVEKILDAIRELEHAVHMVKERATRARNLIVEAENEAPEEM